MNRPSKKRTTPVHAANHERGAGILLHITSLPGPFGCGDMGGEARKFADFLFRAGQKYWQLLPLNPTENDKGYSPYSSHSSMAGNTLLISPEKLADDGWLSRENLRRYKMSSTDKADFVRAEEIKSALFEQAFNNFLNSKRSKKDFDTFCRREKKWLDPYAFYQLLKKIHGGNPWYAWPDSYKNRDGAALRRLGKTHERELTKIRWLQFIFFSQWADLKEYCNRKDIRLFGDLPFYVSYDSADVWSYPEIFSVDKKGSLLFVAGVPPDYFNENGQLWGMPVFRWDVLRRYDYQWWIDRLRKNIEHFDLLRLDHFRAFSDFWAVPAMDDTAKHGSWKRGPGSDFFHVAKKKLGNLPFVAEDLGDIDEPVYVLRNTFGFPGMKVLHFAFSENMPTSDYIPHNFTSNFLVYTGTHDNNTTRGWYRNDISEIEKENLSRYFGHAKVSARNIHVHLIRLAYGSVARLAIIPLQDLLGLDEKARFNAPATIAHNWEWRLLPKSLAPDLGKWLKVQAGVFNR